MNFVGLTSKLTSVKILGNINAKCLVLGNFTFFVDITVKLLVVIDSFEGYYGLLSTYIFSFRSIEFLISENSLRFW